MENITKLHLSFFEELHNRRNEIDSINYMIFKSWIDNTYKMNAMLRSWFFMLNSHYEWFTKRLFQEYLDHIYINNSYILNKTFYYDTLEKINSWRINNIPFSRLEFLMHSLNLPVDNFLGILEKKLFQKSFFKKQIKDLKFCKKFYINDDNWVFSMKKSLISILKNILIEKRNQIWHWELTNITKEEFIAMKTFLIWFFWILTEFIIDNIENETFLNK